MSIKTPSPSIRRALLFSLAAAVLAGSLMLGALPDASARSAQPAVREAAGSSFQSDFNGAHDGWQEVFGSWQQGPAYFTTVGKEDFYSSIKHSGTYKNFIFSARIKRTGSNTAARSGLIVRSDPTTLSPISKIWDDGFYMVYALDGWVYIGVPGSGPYYAANTAPLDLDGWNTLKIVAYDSMAIFYVNGTRIFYKEDMPFLNGSLGILMNRPASSTNNKLFVDWARLQVLK